MWPGGLLRAAHHSSLNTIDNLLTCTLESLNTHDNISQATATVNNRDLEMQQICRALLNDIYNIHKKNNPPLKRGKVGGFYHERGKKGS